MRRNLVVGMFAVVLLAGCSTSAEETPASDSQVAVDTSTPVASPAPSEEPSITEASEPAEEPATVSKPDRTQQLKDANPGASWLDYVTTAIETEPGRVTVETTLVDPRGDDGSPEAETAIAICEAAVALDSTITNVTVAEQDGTSWILFGHPLVPVGECGEV